MISLSPNFWLLSHWFQVTTYINKYIVEAVHMAEVNGSLKSQNVIDVLIWANQLFILPFLSFLNAQCWCLSHTTRLSLLFLGFSEMLRQIFFELISHLWLINMECWTFWIFNFGIRNWENFKVLWSLHQYIHALML